MTIEILFSCRKTLMYKRTNTLLLHKRKYHCTADLLFDWLGFSCFAYVEQDRVLQFGRIQTSQARGQLYSDTSPYEVSECSLNVPSTSQLGTRSN